MREPFVHARHRLVWIEPKRDAMRFAIAGVDHPQRAQHLVDEVLPPPTSRWCSQRSSRSRRQLRDARSGNSVTLLFVWPGGHRGWQAHQPPPSCSFSSSSVKVGSTFTRPAAMTVITSPAQLTRPSSVERDPAVALIRSGSNNLFRFSGSGPAGQGYLKWNSLRASLLVT